MGSPSDWVSGERVFAPPTGTLDVDWLVPAVVEAVPGTSPAEARVALLEAWRDVRAGRSPAPVEGRPPTDPLRRAAERVVAEALQTFRA